MHNILHSSHGSKMYAVIHNAKFAILKKLAWQVCKECELEKLRRVQKNQSVVHKAYFFEVDFRQRLNTFTI